jgi:acyl-CoA synthetase (AMP-forming)/AMP-acid ligase II
LGSSGCLIPGFEVKLVSPEGVEITEYDTPGELVARSPSIVLGYLNNDKATKETFEDGWLRTGDEAVVRVSPKGNEHVFIVDRIKELIKVKVCMTFISLVYTISNFTCITGTPSRPGRTGSPPSHASRCCRLRRDPSPR